MNEEDYTPKPKKKGRPPLKKVVPRQNVMVRLPDPLIELLDKLAYEKRLSRTRIVEEILEKWASRQKK